MTFDIKAIEDLSLNAWPSHQMQIYDGWLLRFSYFYTHRTNSIEQIGPSSVSLEEKVNYCEHVYRRWKTPCAFKITPLTDPALQSLLAERGYRPEHKTHVMGLSLSHDNYNIEETPTVHMRVQDHIPASWIEGLFSLKNTTNPIHRKIVPSMYAAIPKDVIAVSIRDCGEIVATGLGILDRDYIGIYAIHVKETHRHLHLASSILHTLLHHGHARGASKAYLQVVAGNRPAAALYEKTGFHRLYDYYFMVK